MVNTPIPGNCFGRCTCAINKSTHVCTVLLQGQVRWWTLSIIQDLEMHLAHVEQMVNIRVLPQSLTSATTLFNTSVDPRITLPCQLTSPALSVPAIIKALWNFTPHQVPSDTPQPFPIPEVAHNKELPSLAIR